MNTDETTTTTTVIVEETTTTTTKLEGVGEEVVVTSSPEQEEQLQQSAKEEVAKQTDAEILKTYLEENATMLAETADGIRKKLGKINKDGWFDLIMMCKFTGWKKPQDAIQTLNLLKLARLLVAEKRQGKEMYKITINRDARLRVLNSMLKEVNLRKKEIEEEIDLLNTTTTTTIKESTE